MTDTASSWTEVRYSGAQALPDRDGRRDELDGIALWVVDAVRCFHDRAEQVVAHSEVAVFDLEAGPGLWAAAAAYGGRIHLAATMLLDPAGGVQPDLQQGDVDRIVLFLLSSIGPSGRGLGLPAATAVALRLGSARSMVACFPDPPATDAENPEFFAETPLDIREQWWRRGLAYRDAGLWWLPPRAAVGVRAPVSV